MQHHPLAPYVLPHCKKYPIQAAALFQAYLDLTLGQRWLNLEVVELVECECIVLKGRPKDELPFAFAYPVALSTALSMKQIAAIFDAINIQTAVTLEPSVETMLLAITERDSSCVYYVINKGIVSPKEVAA